LLDLVHDRLDILQHKIISETGNLVPKKRKCDVPDSVGGVLSLRPVIFAVDLDDEPFRFPEQVEPIVTGSARHLERVVPSALGGPPVTLQLLLQRKLGLAVGPWLAGDRGKGTARSVSTWSSGAPANQTAAVLYRQSQVAAAAMERCCCLDSPSGTSISTATLSRP
jgi:hypothetical protein